jgi:hypothetical protein
MRELLDTREAEAYTKLARQTLAELRHRGGGPTYIAAGRKILYDRASIDAWLSAREKTSTSDTGKAPRRAAAGAAA